jgi:hypothetical protein
VTAELHARHLAQLGFLEQILKEAEVPTTLLERSEELPLNVLMAGITKDERGRDRFVHFSFLPLDDETDIQAVELLQIYHTFPFRLAGGRRAAVAELLLEANTRLPIGHFGLNENEELHYRYVYALSGARTFDADEIGTMIGLFVSMCDLFAESLEAVASGAKEPAGAVADWQ